jgi:hypothetical protein
MKPFSLGNGTTTFLYFYAKGSSEKVNIECSISFKEIEVNSKVG